jgi:restriction endonuclease Mrr
METAEQQNIFSLLTDARLRDMYCAARQGASMLSAAPEELSSIVAEQVLAGSYAAVEDPKHCLIEATTTLRHARKRSRLALLQRRAVDAKRRGDAALERELVREILTTRRQVD